MAGWESGDVQNTDAARQAAEVAVELSEQEQAPDPRRLVRALRGVARSSARVAGSARRGAGTAGRGAASLLNWLTTQVIAMGPRLRIRDQGGQTVTVSLPVCWLVAVASWTVWRE